MVPPNYPCYRGRINGPCCHLARIGEQHEIVRGDIDVFPRQRENAHFNYYVSGAFKSAAKAFRTSARGRMPGEPADRITGIELAKANHRARTTFIYALRNDPVTPSVGTGTQIRFSCVTKEKIKNDTSCVAGLPKLPCESRAAFDARIDTQIRGQSSKK